MDGIGIKVAFDAVQRLSFEVPQPYVRLGEATCQQGRIVREFGRDEAA